MKLSSSRVISLLLAVLLVFATLAGCTNTVDPDEPTESTTVVTTKPEETTEPVTEPTTSAADVEYVAEEEVTVSDETLDLVNDTKADIKAGEDLSTDKIPEGSIEEEKSVIDEGVLEEDGVIDQFDISYDGTSVNTGKGAALLGPWQGITYYAQNDSRWAKVPYTSIGDKSQTIKSSGCGPTSAAMVVSSSKGAILPTTMAKLFVDNKFRTPNNGTAWSAFAFVADYFGFKEFYTTTSYEKVFKYLETDKDKDGVSDYFVIMTCASGLWTTGGHYIAILSDDDNVLGVRDPFPYDGKYGTVSRKAAQVKVIGNIAYVTEANFKKFSNMKIAFIFSNDHKVKNDPGTSGAKKVKYVRYVATEKGNLNVRKGPGLKYAVIDYARHGSKVTVTAVKDGWSQIGSGRWVSSKYLSATPIKEKTKVVYKTTVGKTYKLKSPAKLYDNGKLTGTAHNYKANTTLKVLSHYSTTVDKVYIPANGKTKYIKASTLK